LYITYDGLTDALGQSQILPYLSRLSALNHTIHIISWEKRENYFRNIEHTEKLLKSTGIVWHKRWYTKFPPIFSTISDLVFGYFKSINIYNSEPYTIVHCRGYLSSLIGIRLKWKFKVKFIFDMRGWWPDEKIESGHWNNYIFKTVYRYFKKQEAAFFRFSDFVVSLTLKGRAEIIDLGFSEVGKVGVIPTCVDFDTFPASSESSKNETRRRIGIDVDEKVFVYSGSIGGNYDPQILVDVFCAFKKIYTSSYLLILSKERIDHAVLSLFKESGIVRYSFHNLNYNEVSDYLIAGDYGFIYYKQSFSVIGRSPTKLGEYWASGLSVISFKGIGDLDFIFEKYKSGGLLLSGENENWESEMTSLKQGSPEQLRKYSIEYFHINNGVAFYNDIYTSLDFRR
jgi:hypothetical protein